MYKKITLTLLFSIALNFAFSYGSLGHRTISAVAEQYLSCSAKRAIKKLLKDENLILVSTYSDDVKSDRAFDAYYTWHFSNLEDNDTYATSKKHQKGDLVTGFNHCVAVLQDKNASISDKQFCLKYLVHIIGDAHQPLHVGRFSDKGGNTIKVKWFGKTTNLHRVWDEDMLKFYGMSYSELAANMPKTKRRQRKELAKGNMENWLDEIHPITKEVYNSAKPNENLGYRYMYDHFETLRNELNLAGIRLAMVLNEIF